MDTMIMSERAILAVAMLRAGTCWRHSSHLQKRKECLSIVHSTHSKNILFACGSVISNWIAQLR